MHYAHFAIEMQIERRGKFNRHLQYDTNSYWTVFPHIIVFLFEGYLSRRYTEWRTSDSIARIRRTNSQFHSEQEVNKAMKAIQLSGMLLLILVWLPVNLAWSCAFDTDCQPGSRCVKASGSIYGVCVGGISPGNRNDREPADSPLDPNRTYGK